MGRGAHPFRKESDRNFLNPLSIANLNAAKEPESLPESYLFRVDDDEAEQGHYSENDPSIFGRII